MRRYEHPQICHRRFPLFNLKMSLLRLPLSGDIARADQTAATVKASIGIWRDNAWGE
jgi:hypothetical protein